MENSDLFIILKYKINYRVGLFIICIKVYKNSHLSQTSSDFSEAISGQHGGFLSTGVPATLVNFFCAPVLTVIYNQ